MELIKFSNLNLQYGEKNILKDFSLEINEGEKVLIQGKSGAGKSTLFKILLEFTKFDSGELFIANKKVNSSTSRETRKMFAYVNQDVTLRQGNVRSVLKEISNFSGNNYEGNINETLAEKFDFSIDLFDKKTEELSGGERQRLGIIIAILLDRPIFLLDEVTSALDTELKEKVVKYFSNTEKTVVCISHDKEWLETGNFRKVVF
ncbi:ABC transporter ATP-binding protein [Clostridium sp. DL1XJH146]